MSAATERLIIGRGYPHAAAANTISFTTTAAQYSATSAAQYDASGTTSATFKRAPRFVYVANDDSTNFITVSVGTSDIAPTAAAAGHIRVYPRSAQIIQLEEGVPIVSVKADTANCVGTLVWLP